MWGPGEASCRRCHVQSPEDGAFTSDLWPRMGRRLQKRERIAKLNLKWGYQSGPTVIGLCLFVCCCCCFVSRQGCCSSCGRRSCGYGDCARGTRCHGLHLSRNRRILHSNQDDVYSSHCQWGRSCRGQSGGYSAVSGGSWTLCDIQSYPGLCWDSSWGLAGFTPFQLNTTLRQGGGCLGGDDFPGPLDDGLPKGKSPTPKII
ncbi:uncharacterized protein [Symphalangus syndactylus]|uniref:uncharacterized protein n=1 Tax=Symphalangus syndactylus TaxID=9590 RepID=UPI0030064968